MIAHYKMQGQKAAPSTPHFVEENGGPILKKVLYI